MYTRADPILGDGSRDPVSGEVWVLLGSEKRRNKLVLSSLGGKREDADASPEHTAWREFWEESGKVNKRSAFFLTLTTVVVFCCSVCAPLQETREQAQPHLGV